MSSNYPDGMTAADHAYLDGVPDDCEHENSYCEGWRYPDKAVDKGWIILEMRCDDCGATSEQDIEIDNLLDDIKMEKAT